MYHATRARALECLLRVPLFHDNSDTLAKTGNTSSTCSAAESSLRGAKFHWRRERNVRVDR